MALDAAAMSGKSACGLFEQAGQRLAAVALVFVVGAEVEGVDVGADALAVRAGMRRGSPSTSSAV